jgi:hypothetical protein
MLGTKAAHGHGSLHGAVQRFLAIALAGLLSAGGAAAQTLTKSETKSEIKSELKSESGSNHLRGGWYPWGSLPVPRLQARGSRPHRL